MKTINGFLISFSFLLASIQLIAQTDHHWNELGDRGFSENLISDPFFFNHDIMDIEIGPDSMEYIAFVNQDSMVNVMKYDGSSWVQVGNSDFAKATELDMEIADNGTIYIVIKDFHNLPIVTGGVPTLENGHTSLMFFNPSLGGNWAYVNNGFRRISAFFHQLEIKSDGKMIVGSVAFDPTSEGRLEEYDPIGDTWTTYPTNLSAAAVGSINQLKLALDNNDRWILAVIHPGSPSKGRVYRQGATIGQSIAIDYQIGGTIKNHNIAVSSNGDYYVAMNNGGLRLYKSIGGAGPYNLIDSVLNAGNTHEVSVKFDENDSLMIASLFAQKPTVWTLSGNELIHVGNSIHVRSDPATYGLIDLEFARNGKPVIITSHDDSVSVIRTCVGPNEWTGGGGDLMWENDNNWSCGRVPNAEDDVVINTPGATQPVLLQTSSDVTIKSLKLTHANSLLRIEGTLRVTESEASGIETVADSLYNAGNIIITSASDKGIYQVQGIIINEGTITITGSGNEGINIVSTLTSPSTLEKIFLNKPGASVQINNTGISALKTEGGLASFINEGTVDINGADYGIHLRGPSYLGAHESFVNMSDVNIKNIRDCAIQQQALINFVNTGTIDINDSANRAMCLNKRSIFLNEASGSFTVSKMDSMYSATKGICSFDTSNLINEGMINIMDVKEEGVCNETASILENKVGGIMTLGGGFAGLFNSGNSSLIKNSGQLNTVGGNVGIVNQNCAKVLNLSGTTVSLKTGKKVAYFGAIKAALSKVNAIVNKDNCSTFENQGNIDIDDSEGDGLCNESGGSFRIMLGGKLVIKKVAALNSAKRGICNTGNNSLFMNEGEVEISDTKENAIVNENCAMLKNIGNTSGVSAKSGKALFGGIIRAIRAAKEAAAAAAKSAIRNTNNCTEIENTGEIMIEDSNEDGLCNHSGGVIKNKASGMIKVTATVTASSFRNQKSFIPISAIRGICNTGAGTMFMNEGQIEISDTDESAISNEGCATFKNMSGTSFSLKDGKSIAFFGSINILKAAKALTKLKPALMNTGNCTTFENEGNVQIEDATHDGVCNESGGSILNKVGALMKVVKSANTELKSANQIFLFSSKKGICNKGMNTQFMNEGTVEISDTKNSALSNEECATFKNGTTSSTSVKNGKKTQIRAILKALQAAHGSLANAAIANSGKCSMIENEGDIEIEDAGQDGLCNEKGGTLSNRPGGFITFRKNTHLYSAKNGIVNTGDSSKMVNEGLIEINDADSVGIVNIDSAKMQILSLAAKLKIKRAKYGLVNTGLNTIIENTGEVNIEDPTVDAIINESGALFVNGNASFTTALRGDHKKSNALASFVTISTLSGSFSRGLVNRGSFSILRNFGRFNITGFRNTAITNRRRSHVINGLGGIFQLSGVRTFNAAIDKDSNVAKSSNQNEMGILNTGDSTIFENLGEIFIDDISTDGICNDSAAIFINGEVPSVSLKGNSKSRVITSLIRISNTGTAFANIGQRTTTRNYGSFFLRFFNTYGIRNRFGGSLRNFSNSSIRLSGLRSLSASLDSENHIAKNVSHTSDIGLLNEGDSTSFNNEGMFIITNTNGVAVMNTDSAELVNLEGGHIEIDSIGNDMAIENASCILNDMDAEISVKAAINNSDSIKNKGLILLEYQGMHSNTGIIINNGLIDDVLPGSNFTELVQNNTVMAVPISGVRGEPISNTLKIAPNYTEIEVDGMWYTDSLLTDLAGDYNSDTNEFIPECTLPLGLSKLWMKSTYTSIMKSDTVPILITISPGEVTLICKDTTISLGSDGFLDLAAQAVIEDNADGCGALNFEFINSVTSFDCEDIGSQFSVTLKASDETGANKSCSSTVTIVDEVKPEVLCKDFTVELDKNGQASITAINAFDALNSSDNCSEIITADSLDKSSFGCLDIGSQQVTLFASDVYNNSSTCIANVEVVNPLLGLSDDYVDGAQVLCPGQGNIDYTASLLPDVNYNWNIVGSGLSISNGQNTKKIETLVSNGVINASVVAVVDNVCTSLKDTLEVISAPPVICQFSNCVDSSFLETGTLASEEVPDIFHADRILASDAIVFTKDFTFRSGQTISFEPGFEITDGRSLIAEIMPCINSSSLTAENIKYLKKEIIKAIKNFSTRALDTECFMDVDNDNICDDVDECIDIDGDGYGMGLGCQGPDCLDSDPDTPSLDQDCDGVKADLDCNDNDLLQGKCDIDNDGVRDDIDNCPNTANADQRDFDRNGVGDVCQEPLCGTSTCSDGDPCTTNDQWNEDCQCIGVLKDSDKDGVCDFYDQCEGYDDTRDWDSDGIPDGCDDDPSCTDCEPDENGILTICWIPFKKDNLKTIKGDCEYLTNFFDEEGRLEGENVCGPCECDLVNDKDTDGDGVCDRKDECPENANLSKKTECGCEEISEICDDDLDGIKDDVDNCPNSPNTDQKDTDNDGIGDVCDDFNCVTGASCDDGNECTENDRYDNNCNCLGTEGDDDNDGVCNVLDQCHGFKDYKDENGNGIPDGCDIDESCNSCQPDNRGRIVICRVFGGKRDMVNISGKCRDLLFLFNDDGSFISDNYSCGQCKCELIKDKDSDEDGFCDRKDACPSDPDCH